MLNHMIKAIHRCCVASLLLTSWASGQLPPIPKTGQSSGPDQPKLLVAQRFFDLGTIVEGDKTTITWLLENRGKAPLVIDSTRSTCGCTVVSLTDAEKTIAPGATFELRASFDSTGRHDIQNKSVKVFSNDPLEPELSLSFTVKVEFLYRVDPTGLVNLRAIRRGARAERTIDLIPASQDKPVMLLAIEGTETVPIHFTHEPLETPTGPGVRIRMTVGDALALGRLSSKITLQLDIGGIRRERVVRLRADIIGDLTWHPKVLDSTRHPSMRGKRFAPIIVKSTNKSPFQILSASVEPANLFDVAIEPGPPKSKPHKYSVIITLRDDAPAGPYGATIVVETTSLDQPVIRIPTFGIVASTIEIDPAVIVLRADGTDMGRRRRLTVRVPPRVTLDITGISSSLSGVTGVIDREAGARYHHLRFLDVSLDGTLPKGEHRGVLTLTTNIDGARRIDIPIRVEVPGENG